MRATRRRMCACVPPCAALRAAASLEALPGRHQPLHARVVCRAGRGSLPGRGKLCPCIRCTLSSHWGSVTQHTQPAMWDQPLKGGCHAPIDCVVIVQHQVSASSSQVDRHNLPSLAPLSQPPPALRIPAATSSALPLTSAVRAACANLAPVGARRSPARVLALTQRYISHGPLSRCMPSAPGRGSPMGQPMGRGRPGELAGHDVVHTASPAQAT